MRAQGAHSFQRASAIRCRSGGRDWQTARRGDIGSNTRNVVEEWSVIVGGASELLYHRLRGVRRGS
jgi:hypothetical protein